MPFQFKLSKRLALIKAALAASAALALACERADPTNPQPLPSSGPQPGPTATIIFQDGFESGNLSLWTQEPNNGRYSITTNAARVKSGTRSLQTLYSPTNAYGFLGRWFMPGYDEVYLKFNVMFEENFQNMRPDGNGGHYAAVIGNRIDNSRSSFGTAGTKPNGTDFFYAGVDPQQYPRWDPTLRPFSFYTYWPDQTGSYGTIIPQPSPQTPLVGGQWQEVIVHIKMNTPGQYNGSETLWINGVKKIEKLNMRWRTTTDLRINLVRFDNYMDKAPKTEYVWLDDVTVWRP
jgi:polysaccharide lyase-like protein